MPSFGNIVVSTRTVTVTENTTANPLGIDAPSDPLYDLASLIITVDALPGDGAVTLADGLTPVTAGQQLSGDGLIGLLFTPTAGRFNQSADFTYTVGDPLGDSGTGTVTLAIGPAVGDPVASSPTLLVAQNAAATAIGIGAPTDPNFTTGLLITADTLPGNGTVTLADGTTAVIQGQQLSSDELTGLLFTPAPGQFASSSDFAYTVTDPAGNSSAGDAALVIGPAVGDPVASPRTLLVLENAAATPIGIAAPADPNYDPTDLTITALTLPGNGTVTLADGSAVTANQTLSSDDLAGLRFTPTPALGNQSADFTYAVADPAGNTSAGAATLAIADPNIDPVTSVALPVIDPASTGSFEITNVGISVAGSNEGTVYSGPVSYLEHQFFWTGTQAIAVEATVPNVFLHGGDAGDALTVTSGNNVLDGGGGSNFLVGGLGLDGGNDVFFVDGRSPIETWSTVVNFHQGDHMTLWGFQDGVSTTEWAPMDGAAGHQGATLHSEIAGPGTGISASVTFAGISLADAGTKFTVDHGSVDGNIYLHITYTG